MSDTEKSNFHLPIIDLKRAKTNRKQEAAKVVHALENIGFLFIDNVDGVDFDELYRCCKWFFDLPMEVKSTLTRNFWNPNNKNIYRGYFPVKEGFPSRKEGFEFARDVDPNDPSIAPGNWFYEKSVWPAEDGSFNFKEQMQNFYEIMHHTAMEILRLTAIGLGIEENAFQYLFSEKPCSTFRLMHYPPWEDVPPDDARIEDGKVVTTPDHTDSNFLTLLATFNYKGLEVMTADGKWNEVEPRPQSLVMNIGDVFSRMMGGRFKATHHRVIDIGIDRYSVPFFLSPAYDGDIGVNFMSKATGVGPEHIPEKYGPWVLHAIKHVKKYFEYRVLPEF